MCLASLSEARAGVEQAGLCCLHWGRKPQAWLEGRQGFLVEFSQAATSGVGVGRGITGDSAPSTCTSADLLFLALFSLLLVT